MNYAGALGGPEEFDDDEILFSFSQNIKEDYVLKVGIQSDVLFIPPIDPREFNFKSEKEPYQIVYAGKYRTFVGKPPSVGSLPSIEIFREGSKVQPRELVKKLIANASVVYSFENSSIVTEAILSGTPAGFIPNEFLGKVIAEKELGWAGSFLGDSSSEIDRARSTVVEGAKSYKKMIDEFPSSLENFVSKTQFVANSIGVGNQTQIPMIDYVVTRNRLKIAIQILKTQGPVQLAKELNKFMVNMVRG
jgi:hypothetical protein